MDLGFPHSHNIICIGPIRQEALVLIPQFPFLWILPGIYVHIYVFKRIRLLILNLNLNVITKVGVWASDNLSNLKWGKLPSEEHTTRKYPTNTSWPIWDDGGGRSHLRPTDGASSMYSSQTVPSSINSSSTEGPNLGDGRNQFCKVCGTNICEAIIDVTTFQ